MLLSTGIDIVEISTIEQLMAACGDRFLHRVYTLAEIKYCHQKFNCPQHFAVRFAAKEAVMKALGCGWSRGVQWKQIEVVNDERGKPEIVLTGKALEIYNMNKAGGITLSVSHSRDFAVASVVMVMGPAPLETAPAG